MTSEVDAVVVGSGPNGLAAAVTLAGAGLSVTVLEGADSAGGGCRTEALTLPGFRHDVCSTAHPMVLTSPFFRQPAFEGLRASLRQPEVPFAHPLDGGEAAAALSSVEATADLPRLGRERLPTAPRPLGRSGRAHQRPVLAPLRSVPRRPVSMARFGLPGLLPVSRLVTRFESERAKALLAGVSAHSMAKLTSPLTSAFGLFLTLTAHAAGWPVVEHGSSGISDAMIAELERLGGRVVTGQWVRSLDALPPAGAVVVDTSPKGLVSMAGPALPSGYGRALRRFRYGPGVCKVDWALSGPVPWSAEVCRRAGTLHLGGTFEEVAASEAEVNAGPAPRASVLHHGAGRGGRPHPGPRRPAGPVGLLPRAVGLDGGHDRAIEAQIERFAPGFSDLVLARTVRTAAEEEAHNPNYVGGDIAGGASTLVQTVFRPTIRWNPYRTPWRGSTCALPRRPLAPAYTACAGSMPPGPCSMTTSAGRRPSGSDRQEAWSRAAG